MAKRVAYFEGENAARRENLDKPSKDNMLMRPYWEKVETILLGEEALRLAKEKYLPKFPGENKTNYDFRLSMTKFTNVYADIVEGLASRPFEAPVDLDTATSNDVPPQIEEFVTDVDGAQNNLTSFAASWFYNGINDAVDWVFIDYPDVPVDPNRARSQAEEKALGIRPNWSRVRAINALEVKSKVIAGTERIVYFRLLEPDETANCVRIMEYDETTGLATWSLWKQNKDNLPTANTVGGTTLWDFEKEGVFSIGIIPMVPFITGRRDGRRWHFKPPMKAAADLQIEVYLEESGLKHISTMAAFPIYAGNGVAPDKDDDGKPKPLTVGPAGALYAPLDGKGNHGTWVLLEPSASSLTFLQSKVDKTILNLREIGRNPLTAQSGNVTVITSAVASQKANSAVQMWAMNLKNAIEAALHITALWLGIKDYKPVVSVYTDFDIDGEGAEDLTALKDARASGDISRETYLGALVRRNVLPADFDAKANDAQLLAEGPPDDGSELDDVPPKAGQNLR